MAESSEPEMLIEIAKSAVFFGTGIVFGYHAFGKKNAWWRKKSKKRTYTDDESEFESDEEWSDVSDPSDSDLIGDQSDEIIPGDEYKMVLCVRMDLKMGKGKMCAQCGHAAVGAVRTASVRVPNQLRRWEQYGQPKIALKVPTEDEMDILKAKAMSLNLNFCVIKDAGRTQIAAGSKTVLAIGPGPQSLIGTEHTLLKYFISLPAKLISSCKINVLDI
ncbi:unnamed protein product [Oikopleura dioica]|uniref:Peptidyl-tRNA hydrolase 2, mitochondrial n=1 Tax=Oikopleura dioica TaxID=34765 RepID=E4X8D8_OIKDI|nr:unnamed protein product [Oikopleura dioica]